MSLTSEDARVMADDVIALLLSLDGTSFRTWWQRADHYQKQGLTRKLMEILQRDE